MEKFISKFEQTLAASNKEIKANRAKIVTESSKEAMEELVRDAKKKKRAIEVAIMDLSDLNVVSKTSTNVVKKDFNALEWLTELRNKKIELLNAEIELSVVEEMYTEWFAPLPVSEEPKTEAPISE